MRIHIQWDLLGQVWHEMANIFGAVFFCEKLSDQLQNRRNPSCCKSQNVFNNRLIFRLISLAAEAQLGVFLADAFTLWPDKGTSNWILHSIISMIVSLKAKAYPCLSYNDRTSRCKTKTVKYKQLRWMKRKRTGHILQRTHARTINTDSAHICHYVLWTILNTLNWKII